MYINTSTPQHLDIQEMTTALVCVWQLNLLWEVPSVPFIVSDKENKKSYN